MNDLTVIQHDDVLVVDSRLIASELGILHRNLVETIESHKTHIEQGFGILRFETEKLEGRGRPNRFAYLTEDQATFVMTLSRNTERVVECKLNLVKAFSAAKKSLMAPRHDELAPMRLELELAQSRERSLQLLATLDPALVSAVFGRSDTPIATPIAAAPNPQPTPQMIAANPDVSSTWAFIDQCLKPGDINGPRQPVSIKWLYSCYKAFCVAINARPIGFDNWRGEVKTILPFNVVRRRNIGGKIIPTEWVWIDVRFGLFCFENGAPKIIPTRLGDGGVAEFQRWASQYGPLYPYDHRTLEDDLAAMESNSLNTPG